MTAAQTTEITEADLPEVAAYLARQTPPGEATTAAPLAPANRLRWLLLQNPARTEGIPLGWCIRDERGPVVGAAICSPFRINAGHSVFTALMFSKFYVDPPHRGLGLGLLMRFVREGRRFPLFCTSTNAIAGELFAKVGAKQINGMDHTMLGVARPAPLVEEWLHRRCGNTPLARFLSLPATVAPSWIKRIATAASTAGRLTPIASADEAADVAPPTDDRFISVIRDRAYLHWRYFTGERNKHVYRFEFPGHQSRLVVINEVSAGYRGQIRVLNVLEVWPPADADSAPALCTQLSLRYRGKFDTIWLRSQPPSAENAQAHLGFIRHAFPAPLGWYIDKENRLSSNEWYVMPGESE